MDRRLAVTSDSGAVSFLEDGMKTNLRSLFEAEGGVVGSGCSSKEEVSGTRPQGLFGGGVFDCLGCGGLGLSRITGY